MATVEGVRESPPPSGDRCYVLDPAQVVAQLGVVLETGLSGSEAAARLERDGPNTLPVEEPPSAIRRFLVEFSSYMQIILVGAAIVSLLIKEWTTAIVLVVISVFNAVVGLRQAGKAESAMNALQSMMKATARVRRDGVETEIPAEQLVAGDVVLIAAGDEVPADGRIVSSSALQIDESALTGESVPAAKDAATLSGGDVGPGEQSNMAFMHTPVTHGSGVVVVTGTGSDTEVGKIAAHALGDGERGDAAHEADEHSDTVDRGRSGAHDDRHVCARSEPRAVVDDAVRYRYCTGHRGHPARCCRWWSR